METYSRSLFERESPFYARLTRLMAADVEAGGPCWELLGPYALEPSTEYYPLRALAGVHRMALDGSAPDLRSHYPSVGGDGDVEAAWPAVRAALGDTRIPTSSPTSATRCRRTRPLAAERLPAAFT